MCNSLRNFFVKSEDLDQYHRDIRRVVKGVDLFEEVGDGTSVPDFNQDGIYATVCVGI